MKSFHVVFAERNNAYQYIIRICALRRKYSQRSALLQSEVFDSTLSAKLIFFLIFFLLAVHAISGISLIYAKDEYKIPFKISCIAKPELVLNFVIRRIKFEIDKKIYEYFQPN